MEIKNELPGNVSDAKFDLLKYVLSLVIVAIHSSLFPEILYPWLRIAVPMFFIIGAYFFFLKQNVITDKAEKASALKQYILRNGKLYAFWFTFLLPVTLYARRNEWFAGSILDGVEAFFRSLFFGSTFIASWYITASIIGTVMIWFASKKLSNKSLLIIGLIIHIIVSLISSYGFLRCRHPVLDELLSLCSGVLKISPVSYGASLLWIVCGKCFAERSFAFKKEICIPGFALSCVLLYGEWLLVRKFNGTIDTDVLIMLAPVCIFFFGWIMAAKAVKTRIESVHFRRLSTLTYALHASIIPVIINVPPFVGNMHLSPLVFVLAVLICMAVYIAIQKLLTIKKDSKIIALLKYAY